MSFPAAAAPVEGMCPSGSELNAGSVAGYTCRDADGSGESKGESIVGFTEQQCGSNSGRWIPYPCSDAERFADANPTHPHRNFLVGVWQRPCCSVSTAD